MIAFTEYVTLKIIITDKNYCVKQRMIFISEYTEKKVHFLIMT